MGFQLCVAINYEAWSGQATTLKARAQQEAELWQDLSLIPGRSGAVHTTGDSKVWRLKIGLGAQDKDACSQPG